MREITVKLYQYSELSPAAQSKARDWFREASTGDEFFAETPVDEFLEIGQALGFTFAPANPNRQPRKPRDAVYYEGFSYQGSGASFDASWSANALNADKVRAILANRPATFERAGKQETCKVNAQLRPILEGFLDLVAAAPDVTASVRASHHGHFLEVDWYHGSDVETDEESAAQDATMEPFKGLCEDFAAWLYRTLEAEYINTQSDEYIAETIIANEYEFTVDGRRAS